jgi:hypothetical protein
MSRIPSLAKYAAPNNFVPRNLSWPGEFNFEYGGTCIWSDYSNENPGSHTSKLTGVNTATTKFWVSLEEGNPVRASLFYKENYTNILGFSQFSFGGIPDVDNWANEGFTQLGDTDSFSINYGSTITFGAAVTGRCGGDYTIWNIWSYAGITAGPQFLIDTIVLFDACT